MSEPIIIVENLSKRYRIGARDQGIKTFREALIDGFTAPIRNLNRLRKLTKFDDGETSRTNPNPVSRAERPADNNIIWALKDVSFEVKQGEILGIIGSNGAGKSTLLKILSRITEPTTGDIKIYGRVSSLLEVGTGFHPELTGRENVFLNGAILGMRKQEIKRKFDEIVAFAETDRFIDTPVKYYSSGMYVRLAFAVAAHLEPEILIVDEVLAVGDTAFQRKCLGKMSNVAREGRTILFVSHNMAAIATLCKSGIWLDKGEMRAFGEMEDIITKYLTSGIQERGEINFPDNLQNTPGTDYIRLRMVRIRDHEGSINTSLDVRLSFKVEIEYLILKKASSLRVGFSLITHDGTVVFSSTDMDDDTKYGLEREPGTYTSSCELPGDFLNWGQYFVSVGSDSPMIQSHFFVDRVLRFNIEQTGGIGGSISDGRRGLLRMKLPWDIQKFE